MNFPEALMIAGGSAALLTAILAAIAFSRKGEHPPTYSLAQEWSHPPILWAAVDEHQFGHVQDQGGHAEEHDRVRVGGGASGTW